MKHLTSLNEFSSNENYLSSDHVMLYEAYTDIMTKLEDCITNKFTCSFYYKGDTGAVDRGYRKVEPYALGVNSKGNTVVRCWLLEGTSKTGKVNPKLVPGWRLFRVDRMSELNVLLQNFTVPRKGYNSEDSGMTEISFAADF